MRSVPLQVIVDGWHVAVAVLADLSLAFHLGFALLALEHFSHHGLQTAFLLLLVVNFEVIAYHGVFAREQTVQLTFLIVSDRFEQTTDWFFQLVVHLVLLVDRQVVFQHLNWVFSLFPHAVTFAYLD